MPRPHQYAHHPPHSLRAVNKYNTNINIETLNVKIQKQDEKSPSFNDGGRQPAYVHQPKS